MQMAGLSLTRYSVLLFVVRLRRVVLRVLLVLYRNYNLNFNVLAVIKDFGLAITVVLWGSVSCCAFISYAYAKRVSDSGKWEMENHQAHTLFVSPALRGLAKATAG